MTSNNPAMLFASVFCAMTGLLHLACLWFGAPLFRWMGAGEHVVRMAESGHRHPYVMAVFVGLALLIYAVLCASLAGAMRPLPYAEWLVAALAVVLAMRGLFFPFLKPYFVGNSELFWWISSALCLFMSATMIVGLMRYWKFL